LRARTETKALVDWLTKEFRQPGMQSETVKAAPIKLLQAASS